MRCSANEATNKGSIKVFGWLATMIKGPAAGRSRSPLTTIRLKKTEVVIRTKALMKG